MYEGRQEKLREFVTWANQHITGDEKSQAHIFLDRFFQAFGQRGCLGVRGTKIAHAPSRPQAPLAFVHLLRPPPMRIGAFRQAWADTDSKAA